MHSIAKNLKVSNIIYIYSVDLLSLLTSLKTFFDQISKTKLNYQNF